MTKQNNNHKIIDGTLDVVHKIQETLWEKNKNLNWQEKIKQMDMTVKSYQQTKSINKTTDVPK